MIRRAVLLFVALIVLGCSEKEEPKKSNKGSQAKAPRDLPAAQKDREYSRKEDLERRDDGLWHKGGKVFEGVAVDRFDSGEIEWEETFEKGVLVGVKGWDEDGEPLELFSWDKDGKPLHQRP